MQMAQSLCSIQLALGRGFYLIIRVKSLLLPSTLAKTQFLENFEEGFSKRKKISPCCWETANISGLKECHYFCCKNVWGSLASLADICSSLSCANANSSSQRRWNIPLCSQTHLSSGLLCSCQQLGHLGFITEPFPLGSHFCCRQFCSESCWASLRCSFPTALHISFLSSRIV